MAGAPPSVVRAVDTRLFDDAVTRIKRQGYNALILAEHWELEIATRLDPTLYQRQTDCQGQLFTPVALRANLRV